MIQSSQQRIIVTGGAGFIGSHLVERLLADGAAVVVIDDCSTGSWDNLAAVRKDPRLTALETKVSDCKDLALLMKDATGVHHLAATVGVDLVMKSGLETIQNNLLETPFILEAASRWRVPFLLASTSEVYGKSAKPEFTEDDDLLIGPPHLHRWSYACSKLMDEFLALSYGREKSLPVVVTRLFNTVGPRQSGKHGMVLPRFIAAALAGDPVRIFGDGQQTRCFCHVADVVEALVRLSRSKEAPGEVVNVGNPEEVTIRQLGEKVLSLIGSTSAIEQIPYDQAYPHGFQDMQRRKPNIDKLRRLVGFRPHWDLARIIRDIANRWD